MNYSTDISPLLMLSRFGDSDLQLIKLDPRNKLAESFADVTQVPA